MKVFTELRTVTTVDEIWLVEHDAVFTLGQAGKREHLLNTLDIPVVQSDRGGQVTYHGPGQLVTYLLIDLKRRSLGIRDVVTGIENSLIKLLLKYGISAAADPKAPGVYVGDAKIAALGLRVKRGRTYHGLSLNVAMDLSPYAGINPCGYAGMPVTDMCSQGVDVDMAEVALELLSYIADEFGYDLPPLSLVDNDQDSVYGE
jgi:lipoyl(octanoyl) transferase